MTMEYKDLIESKNSVRDYKEKEVDAATVKKIRDLPSPVSAWMTVSGSISALWIMIPFTASWTGMQDIKGF